MINDRIHAAKLLAERLSFVDKESIILAIPRGGVVIGDEIARTLGIKLDVIISKKITPPDHPEYAVGAITSDGTIYRGRYWDHYSSDPGFEEEINKKKTEVARQIRVYRGNTDYELDGKSVILVDDGVATGATIFAILEWLSKKKTKEVILAIPVIPYATYEALKKYGIKIVAVKVPIEFSAVAQFYRKFEQVPEQIVLDILQKYK